MRFNSKNFNNSRSNNAQNGRRITRPSTLLLATLLPAGLLLGGAAIPQSKTHTAAHSTAGAQKSASSFDHDVAPVIKKYCVSCHSGASPSAGLALDVYHDAASVIKGRDVWEKVSKNIADGHMPPQGMPKPTPAQKELTTTWIDNTFAAQCRVQDPGHVTLRRLNRSEYNNTVRDLLGVDIHPADDFPNDDVGYGFDNIGEVLSISPLLMEKYVNAADKITRAAIVTPEDGSRPTIIDLSHLPSTASGGPEGKVGRNLNTTGEVYTDYTFPRSGKYTLRATACGDQAGPDPARMEFRLDNKMVTSFAVPNGRRKPQPYEFTTDITAGSHRLAIAFTNDFYDANEKDARKRDRNLVVNSFELVGQPGLPTTLPAPHRRLFICEPGLPGSPTDHDACARKILTNFMTRAYRRPVAKTEVDRLVRYVHQSEAQGDSFEQGIRNAVQAVLVSPNFLFRVETETHPNDPKSHGLVGSYELATRLSYFLWGSMPDQELFALAANGKLQNSVVLDAQVRRMLKDKKAAALADDFAGQWLQLRNLSVVTPDASRYTDFNDKLRTAMKTETEMFFETVVNEDRSILDFIDGKYTYLNEALAKHYGISGVTGDQFQRVSLAGDDKRGGVLTQASVLTVTSNPTRTSPVKRGKWVLEQFFGTPPPPPPPNVGQLPDDKKGPLVGTLRQRMEQHRANPMCASCHARMDPIGFGLENYDGVGAWRTVEGGQPIDSSGTLPDGRSFKGPEQLKQILLGKKELFTRCLSQKMLTFALGRGLASNDTCAVNDIVKSVQKHNYHFSALITAVVQSEPFRKWRGDRGKS